MSAVPSETARPSLYEEIEPASLEQASMLIDRANILVGLRRFDGSDLSELVRIMTRLVGGQRDETGETSVNIPFGHICSFLKNTPLSTPQGR